MLDRRLRPRAQAALAPIAARCGRIRPSTLTLVGGRLGLAAAVAAGLGLAFAAVALWAANRIVDGLDGVVARTTGRTSDAGGYLDMVVGLEMADAFTRMGTEVVVLEAAAQVLPGLLPDTAAVARAALAAKGIDLRPGLVAQAWDPAIDGLRIGPPGAAPTDTIDAVDRVLVAIGRVPNTEGLGLDDAGVATDDGGRIRVDDRGRTSAQGVWAIGDVATTGGTTHAAGAWGRRVVQSIVHPRLPAGAVPARPAVVFTDPEIATVGDQPEHPADDVRRFTVDLSDLDRAYTDEVDHAIMVVDVRKFSGRIVGASIVGPRAGELVATLGLLMLADVGLHRLVHMVMPYPTWSEAFRRLEDQWMATALPQVHRDLGSWARARLRGRR